MSAAEGRPPSAASAQDVHKEMLKEQEYIRRELYGSILDDNRRGSDGEITLSDTVRLAKEAREELTRAALRPINEKMTGFRAFTADLKEPCNKAVLSLFLFTTALMFTLPIVALLIGMHVVAPIVGWDDGACGGLMAVVTTVFIMAGYVVYSLREPVSLKETKEGKKQN
uniref:Uncharacterized protein n=1 Tax=Trypanosoma congolense (strain IL3000) TaxID=1068625 RepID=G0UUG4_TRYCI|nr:conserved hypothetical protein [Trypanosoma congolense IL3000]